MDTTQIAWDYGIMILLGIGFIAILVVLDLVRLGFLLIGVVLILVGGLGQAAEYRNASPEVRTYLNVLGMIGFGGALIVMMLLEDALTPSLAIVAVTLLVLGVSILTEYFSGPVAWGGMTTGFAVAAVVEALSSGSLFVVGPYAVLAVVFAAAFVRSWRRPAPGASQP